MVCTTHRATPAFSLYHSADLNELHNESDIISLSCPVLAHLGNPIQYCSQPSGANFYRASCFSLKYGSLETFDGNAELDDAFETQPAGTLVLAPGGTMFTGLHITKDDTYGNTFHVTPLTAGQGYPT